MNTPVVVITPLRSLYWTQPALAEFDSATAGWGKGIDSEIMRGTHSARIEDKCRKADLDHVNAAAVIAHFGEVR